jgi:hypothetical protein
MLLKERRFLKLAINPIINFKKLIIGFIALVIVVSIEITFKIFK